MNFNMHYTDKKKKYHLYFSKESKFPSDVHSSKLLPLIESRFVQHFNRHIFDSIFSRLTINLYIYK